MPTKKKRGLAAAEKAKTEKKQPTVAQAARALIAAAKRDVAKAKKACKTGTKKKGVRRSA